MSTPSNRFLFLFRDSQPEIYARLSETERRELVSRWTDWLDGLMTAGKVQHGYPLQYEGRVVSGRKRVAVTDGPYAEAKEAVAGYFFLTVSSFDEATEIAKQCPSLPHGISIEVRPIAEFSPALKDLRGRTNAS